MKEIDVAKGIVPLGEFKANASRCLRELRHSERPMVITQNGRPAAVLVSPEAFSELRQDAEFRAAVARGIADAEAGRFVDETAVEAWLESWGTDNELPPPA